MFNKETFAGGVQSRTVKGGTVQHPVVIVLDGVETELTLADATKLREGLTAAIACVETAEKACLDGETGHHFIIGKTTYGMSQLPSKLPTYHVSITKADGTPADGVATFEERIYPGVAIDRVPAK